MRFPTVTLSLAPLLALALIGGCDTPTSGSHPATADGGEPWPRRVELRFSHTESAESGIRLADTTLVAGEGDLALYQAQVLSLGAPEAARVCAKGIYDALEDVPTEIEDCPQDLTGTWSARAYLSASTLHESEESSVVGLGLLVRDHTRCGLFRLRVVGDSYDAQGLSSVTFDYERVR